MTSAPEQPDSRTTRTTRATRTAHDAAGSARDAHHGRSAWMARLPGLAVLSSPTGITVAGMVLNVLLAVGKALIGLAAGSGSLLADAIHSASDLGAAAQDAELGAHIERLLASRYAANAAPCELGALLGRLEAARAAAVKQRKRGARTDALPPLYAAPHAVAAQANMPTMRPIDQ